MVNYDLTVLPGLKVRFGGNHPKIAQHFGLVNDHLPRIIHLTMVFSIFFNHPAMGVPPWLSGWWFGTMEFYDFPFILGMSSSQLLLTPWFFRGVGQPPTSHGFSWIFTSPLSNDHPEFHGPYLVNVGDKPIPRIIPRSSTSKRWYLGGPSLVTTEESREMILQVRIIY